MIERERERRVKKSEGARKKESGRKRDKERYIYRYIVIENSF